MNRRLGLVGLLLAGACGDEGDFEPVELMGVYANSFGREIVITEDRWADFTIRDVDNFANRVIFETTLPGQTRPIFGRIVWTEPDGRGAFFYCFEVSSAATIEVAREAQVSVDASNPRAGGCGEFPWAQAWPAVDIRGDYLDDTGARHTVTATVWRRPEGELALVAWENERSYAVLQNPADHPTDPGRHRRVEWVLAEGDRTFFCDVVAGLATAAGAYTSTRTADRSDPLAGGCNDGPWGRLEPLGLPLD